MYYRWSMYTTTDLPMAYSWLMQVVADWCILINHTDRYLSTTAFHVLTAKNRPCWCLESLQELLKLQQCKLAALYNSVCQIRPCLLVTTRNSSHWDEQITLKVQNNAMYTISSNIFALKQMQQTLALKFELLQKMHPGKTDIRWWLPHAWMHSVNTHASLDKNWYWAEIFAVIIPQKLKLIKH